MCAPRADTQVRPYQSEMANYEFVTIWRIKAPRENVWDLIFHSEGLGR